MKLLTLLGFIALTTLTNAQQIVTLTSLISSGPVTNEVAIASDEYVELLGFEFSSGDSTDARIEVVRAGITFPFFYWQFRPNNSNFREKPITFAGPATVRLRNEQIAGKGAAVSMTISPGQYPPGKSAVIGERDGPMKCTLEESTDLVNWTLSTSGQTHTLTNANDKKFFRIKLEQDVGL